MLFWLLSLKTLLMSFKLLVEVLKIMMQVSHRLQQSQNAVTSMNFQKFTKNQLRGKIKTERESKRLLNYFNVCIMNISHACPFVKKLIIKMMFYSKAYSTTSLSSSLKAMKMMMRHCRGAQWHARLPEQRDGLQWLLLPKESASFPSQMTMNLICKFCLAASFNL